MYESDGDYWERVCKSIREQIAELQAKDLRENHVSEEEARKALSHHLEQLERLGATLEDDICGILRKVEASAKIKKEIEAKEEKLRECTSEMFSAKGY